MEKKSSKTLVTIISAVAIVLYTLFIVKWSGVQYMNSDWANLLLEAKDILDGNVLRSGWTLTGISFLTTDIPFFMIGVLIGGVSRSAFCIGVGLMVVTLSLVSVAWMLHGTDRKNIPLKACVALSFALLHPYYPIYAMKAHAGTFVYTMIVFNLHERCRDSNKPDKYKLVIIALTTLAFMGDGLFCVMTTLPLMFWAFVRWLKKELSNKEAIIWGVTAGAGIPTGVVVSKLYYMIGGANKNGSVVRSTVFSSIDQIEANLRGYVKAILMLAGGDLGGRRVVWPDSPIYIVNAAAVVLFFVLVVFHIVRFIIGKKYEYASLMAGLGFILLSTAYIMTGDSAASGILHTRYICVFTPVVAVVLFRNIDFFRSEKNDRLYLVLLCCMLISVGGRIWQIATDGKQEDSAREYEIAEFLKANDLTDGYAGFWDASIMTVLSGEQVRVRAVQFQNNRIEKNSWFTNEKWYDGKKQFIMTKDNDEQLTGDMVINSYGSPDNILNVSDVSIYVYNDGILAEND